MNRAGTGARIFSSRCYEFEAERPRAAEGSDVDTATAADVPAAESPLVILEGRRERLLLSAEKDGSLAGATAAGDDDVKEGGFRSRQQLAVSSWSTPPAAIKAGKTAAEVRKWLADNMTAQDQALFNQLKGVLKLRVSAEDKTKESEEKKQKSGAAASADSDVSSELSRVLRLRRAISDRKEEEAKEKAVGTQFFIINSAEAAVSRANQLRARHPHCREKPLALSWRLCWFAARVAEKAALKEEASGARLAEDLLRGLAGRVVEVRDEDGVRVILRASAVTCRLPAGDFSNLPLETVNFWYSGGESFPYRDGQSGMKIWEEKHRNFAQLLDSGTERMGWAAAALGRGSGAFYAVAAFDRSSDGRRRQDEAAESRPSVPEPPIDEDYADSYTQLDLQLS